MEGLSYYGMNDFKLSNNLNLSVSYNNEEIIQDITKKREAINNVVRKLVKEKLGHRFETTLKTDISPGGVELIDTGSTSRGTNVGKNADFDFIMRIDEKVEKKEMAKIICEGFGLDYNQAITDEMILGNNNLRLKNVKIEGIKEPVDIDITFISKADEITYTTDMAINDRLETIKKCHPDQYKKVLDNIIYAKNYLKGEGVYKPKHARNCDDGGLGGVGIENWILQNGGSFLDACQSFYDAATEHGFMIPFEKFCKKYKIYDFGENFYNGKYDEFVKDNMTKKGYKTMYQAVRKYLERNKYTYRTSNGRNMEYNTSLTNGRDR